MWIQVFCTASNGYREPTAAKRIDDHLTQSTIGAFVAPDGTPIKNERGEYEVRVLEKHYGLTIVSVVENEE